MGRSYPGRKEKHIAESLMIAHLHWIIRKSTAGLVSKQILEISLKFQIYIFKIGRRFGKVDSSKRHLAEVTANCHLFTSCCINFRQLKGATTGYKKVK